jgi:4-hydroxybenzoate polyprenyltransferase
LKLAALALALLLVALGMARWQTGVLVLFGAGLGCLYAVPLGRRGIRLKAAPGIKSLFVGGAVAIAALGVPVVENQAPMSPSSWTTLACMFTLTATNATLFDIRDVAQDGTRALATLPVLFGVGRVRLGLVMFVCSTLGLLSWCDPSLRQHAIVLSACLVPLSLALGPGSPRPAFTWLVDGALWLPWLVTLVA